MITCFLHSLDAPCVPCFQICWKRLNFGRLRCSTCASSALEHCASVLANRRPTNLSTTQGREPSVFAWRELQGRRRKLPPPFREVFFCLDYGGRFRSRSILSHGHDPGSSGPASLSCRPSCLRTPVSQLLHGTDILIEKRRSRKASNK